MAIVPSTGPVPDIANIRDRVIRELDRAVTDLAATEDDDVGIVSAVVSDLSGTVRALDEVVKANTPPAPREAVTAPATVLTAVWNALQERGHPTAVSDDAVAVIQHAFADLAR